MTFAARLYLLLAAACLALVSCAPAPPRDVRPPSKDPLVWPSPPEEPRFVYETTLRGAVDLEGEKEEDRLRRLLTGVSRAGKAAFNKPVAVAAAKGRIYVADTALRAIVVFDVPRRRVYQFGQRDPGRLDRPSGLALDAAGNVYVVDASAKRVHVYDSLGLFKRSLGDPEEFERPVGVAVNADGTRVYVVDRSTNESDNHRVFALDGEGKRLFEIGPRGGEEGRFNVPVQAAVAADGTLYVLDSGNFRVQVFTAEGKFIRAFGKLGPGFGQFARPRGIAVDQENNVYVTDASFGNFQVFNKDGLLLLGVGTQGQQDRAGRYGLLGGVAVDETGRVYLVDQLFNKVEVIKPVRSKAGSKPQ